MSNEKNETQVESCRRWLLKLPWDSSEREALEGSLQRMSENEARELADEVKHFIEVGLPEMKKTRLKARDLWAAPARPPLEGTHPGESQRERYIRLLRQMNLTRSDFEEDEKWVEGATEDKIREGANLYERFIQDCNRDGILPEDG